MEETVYDAGGRVSRQTFPMNRSVDFGYSGDVVNFSARITNTLGLATVHTYFHNKLLQVVELPGANQAVWNYSYKAGKTWVETVTDPNTHAWSYTWDDNGNMTGASDPLGNTTRYTYTAANDLDVATDADTFPTDYDYDVYGNVEYVRRWDQEHSIWRTLQYVYSPSRPGDVESVRDPRNNVWSFTYDLYGHPDLAKNPPRPGGIIDKVDYDYDGAGRLRRVADANGNPTSYSVNLRGQVTGISDALANTTVYTYDAIGNLQYAADPGGHTTSYAYNLNDEPARVTHPDGSYDETAYDGLGRVYSMTDGLRVATATYSYRDAERRVVVTDALGKTRQYFYDPAGLLAKTIDAEGIATDYAYWENNLPRGVDYHDPANTPSASFGYNGRGLCTSMLDATGTTTYGYDSLGRLTSVLRKNEYLDPTRGKEARVDYEYDEAGNLTTIRYPRHGQLAGPLPVTRHFDEANRMDRVTIAIPGMPARTSAFGYDPAGNLTTVDYMLDDAGGLDARTVITYDRLNLADTITHKNNSGELYFVDYGRDGEGLLRTAQERERGISGGTHTYGYDALDRLKLDRLTFADPSRNTESGWDYDRASQIWQSVITPTGQAPIVTARGYDNAGQLKTFKETQGARVNLDYALGYDANGNRRTLAAGGSAFRSYTYDRAGRLKSPDGGATTYLYDGDGLRQFKCGAIGCYDQEVWDVASGLPLLLQDTRANYVYGPGGMLLAEVIDNFENVDQYYYLLDQQGSVRLLLDTRGVDAKIYDYNAYGAKVELSPDPYNRMGYVGQYEDEESHQGEGTSGFLYMRARYYDPLTQQFISRDPAGGQPYAYAGGDPINFRDINGMAPSRSSIFQSGDPTKEGQGVGGGLSGRGIPGAIASEAVAAQLRAEQILSAQAKGEQTVATVAGGRPATHSGWRGRLGFVNAINLVWNLAREVDFTFERKPKKDEGVPGQHHASHAEVQLAALMYYGKTPKKPIGVSNRTCPECARFFDALAAHTGDDWFIGDRSRLRCFPR